MDQLSLFGDSAEHGAAVKESEPEGLLASAEEVRELAREYFNPSSSTTRTASAPPALLETKLRLKAHATGAHVRGLVAKWSKVFGYVSLHDPTTGEWYEIEAKAAPAWARKEAMKRKKLYKDGNHRAYELTAMQMEEIWKSEGGPLAFLSPAVGRKSGLVYDEDVEEE